MPIRLRIVLIGSQRLTIARAAGKWVVAYEIMSLKITVASMSNLLAVTVMEPLAKYYVGRHPLLNRRPAGESA